MHPQFNGNPALSKILVAELDFGLGPTLYRITSIGQVAKPHIGLAVVTEQMSIKVYFHWSISQRTRRISGQP